MHDITHGAPRCLTGSILDRLAPLWFTVLFDEEILTTLVILASCWIQTLNRLASVPCDEALMLAGIRAEQQSP